MGKSNAIPLDVLPFVIEDENRDFPKFSFNTKVKDFGFFKINRIEA